jgi:UDP-N-acetylglucosamine:LPS N-acetylglucosamine transferase
MRNKLLVVFPDGVGIRNYLYSKVFDRVDELVLFHNFDAQTITTLAEFRQFKADIVIPDYHETSKEKFLRELISLSRLYYNAKKVNNPSLLYNWNWKQPTLAKRLFYKVIELSAKRVRNYKQIGKLEAKYQKAIRQNPFYNTVRTILKEQAPDKVFCTHQRGLKAATIFAAATDLGIPTATVIYSWDNLPKARMALRADNYLVWSDYMKAQLQQFYPEIPEQSIAVTGTPQFEFYADSQNIIDREQFFSQYGLDPDKKIICFSGDDERTSPDDPKYLYDLAQALTNAGLQNNYQILFRRCPVDFSGRYDAVVAQFGDLIQSAPPLWNFNNSRGWTVAFPSYGDVRLLASTAFYADVVLNVGSTMAFDFAMYGKPCIFINYDQEHTSNPEQTMQRIYSNEHFRSMEDKKAVLWLDSKQQIIQTIELAMGLAQNPAMEQWKAKVLGDYKNASQKIAAQLELK